MSVRISGKNYREVLVASRVPVRRTDGWINLQKMFQRARVQAVLYPGNFESRRTLLAENPVLTRNGDNNAGERGKIDPASLPSVSLLEIFDREGFNIGSLGNVDLTRPAITFEALPPAGRRELFRRLDDSNRSFLVLDLSNSTSGNGPSLLVRALDAPKDPGDTDLLALAKLLCSNQALAYPFLRGLGGPEQDHLISLLEEINPEYVTHDIGPYWAPHTKNGWLPRYCSHFEDVRFVGIRHSARNQLLRIARRLDTFDPPADLAKRFKFRIIDNVASTGVLFAPGHAEGHRLSLEVRYIPERSNLADRQTIGPEILFMKWITQGEIVNNDDPKNPIRANRSIGTAYVLTGDAGDISGFAG